MVQAGSIPVLDAFQHPVSLDIQNMLYVRQMLQGEKEVSPQIKAAIQFRRRQALRLSENI
jgi:hypothetical protein